MAEASFAEDHASQYGEITAKGRKAKGYRDQRLLDELPQGMGPRAYMDLLHTNCIQERIQVRCTAGTAPLWAPVTGQFHHVSARWVGMMVLSAQGACEIWGTNMDAYFDRLEDAVLEMQRCDGCRPPPRCG